jgi:hypothetical protein
MKKNNDFNIVNKVFEYNKNYVYEDYLFEINKDLKIKKTKNLQNLITLNHNFTYENLPNSHITELLEMLKLKTLDHLNFSLLYGGSEIGITNEIKDLSNYLHINEESWTPYLNNIKNINLSVYNEFEMFVNSNSCGSINGLKRTLHLHRNFPEHTNNCKVFLNGYSKRNLGLHGLMIKHLDNEDSDFSKSYKYVTNNIPSVILHLNHITRDETFSRTWTLLVDVDKYETLKEKSFSYNKGTVIIKPSTYVKPKYSYLFDASDFECVGDPIKSYYCHDKKVAYASCNIYLRIKKSTNMILIEKPTTGDLV